MPAELDNIDPEMGAEPEMDQPEMGAEPAADTIGLHGGETDREGAMAKADLFKLANYAHKLYQQLDDNDQLESWVQAKITKAADYIASVYHYLEYEMKFSEYGHHLDNSDTLSEGQKMRIKELLSEAKSKVKELKKAQAEKVSEEKSSTGGEIDRSKKGVTKHTQNPNRFSDEEHTEPKSQAKAQSAADKAGDKAADKAEEKEGKNWQKRFGKDSVTRVKDGKKVDEAKKADKDYDGDGKVESGKDEYLGSKIAAAKKAGKLKEGTKMCKECDMPMAECGCDHSVKEDAKPSAGLSKAKKSAVVKDAKAGKDIGKPGKSFDKVAKKAGGGEKGKKIAAAAMWKNIKETTAYVAEKKSAAKPDFLDMDKDGDKKEPMKKAVADKKETVKESTDFTRMQELTGRLNRTEKPALVENREVDQIRALTKRLLG